MNEPIDEDRRRRDEAFKRIGRQIAIWSIPLVAVSVIAIGLGVPWWIVAVVIVFFIYILLFEA